MNPLLSQWMRRKAIFWFLGGVLSAGMLGCDDSSPAPVDPGQDLTSIPFSPVAYQPSIPQGFPQLEQPFDNPMTIAGIRLGRKLFFDPILSIDSTVSCGSCHAPGIGFTDGRAFSQGVAGITPRGSLGLMNSAFHYNGLFWDGRSASLEALALLPVTDPIEMGETWENVEEKLRRHPAYPSDFRKAFGIERKDQISRALAAKAIAQFTRSLITAGQSRFDKFVRGEIFLEDNEYNGYLMYFDLDPILPDAECAHCHNPPLLATDGFFNNGLQEAPDGKSFQDLGRGKVTGKFSDNGLFKPPSLRNIALTAPYMHDGRFQTLAEVIAHYNSGGKDSPTKSPLIYRLKLTPGQQADLLAFLETFTDTSDLVNPAFQSPF